MTWRNRTAPSQAIIYIFKRDVTQKHTHTRALAPWRVNSNWRRSAALVLADIFKLRVLHKTTHAHAQTLQRFFLVHICIICLRLRSKQPCRFWQKKNTRIRNRNGHQKAHILYVTNDMRGLILYSRPTSTARTHVIDCSNGGCVRACAIYCTLYAGTVFFCACVRLLAMPVVFNAYETIGLFV